MRRPTLLAAALATAAVAQDAYAPEIDLYPVPESGLYPIFDPLDPYAAAGGCCVAASYDPGAAGLDPGFCVSLSGDSRACSLDPMCTWKSNCKSCCHDAPGRRPTSSDPNPFLCSWVTEKGACPEGICLWNDECAAGSGPEPSCWTEWLNRCVCVLRPCCGVLA